MRSNPWKILGLKPTKNVKAISEAWRRLAQTTHPDKGGSAEDFAAAKEAYNQALALAPTIVEIRRPDRILTFKLSLKASEVLDSGSTQIAFYDHLGKKVTIEVTIPAWQMSWGSEQTLRLQQVPVSDNTTVTLDIICELADDSLTITKTGLVLSPEVAAATAVGQHQITFDWHGPNTITIDRYGQGLLYSRGYYMEDGTRSNILVKPKYVFN